MNNYTNIVVSRYNRNVDFVYRINDNKNINTNVDCVDGCKTYR